MHTRKLLVGIFTVLALAGAGACNDPFVPEHRSTVGGPVLDGIGFTGGGGKSDTTQTQQQTISSDSTTVSTTGIGFTGSGG